MHPLARHAAAVKHHRQHGSEKFGSYLDQELNKGLEPSHALSAAMDKAVKEGLLEGFMEYYRKGSAVPAKMAVEETQAAGWKETLRADADQHIQYGAAQEETAYPATDDAKEQAVMELFASLIEKEQTEQIIQALKDPGYLEVLLKGCAE